jgi:RNA polymerase sigma factor (sigma-70 family)
MPSDTHRAIEAVWRVESARLIAGLTRIVRDVAVAEELAHDALVAALEQWPATGVPRNPGAWLMTTAKHRALDVLRRGRMVDLKHAELGRELDQKQRHVALDEVDMDDEVGDDLLNLIFIACHPVLPAQARVALTLKLLGGLTTEEIARAFLVRETTVAQRIVRAKRTLAEKQVPFEMPRAEDRKARLASVLEVVYAIFNEGYVASSGTSWTRPTLCEEALRLIRILAELAPQEAEVHGLAALLEIQASRLRARIDAQGKIIRLLDQDRSRWDWLLVRRGLTALDRALKLFQPRGPYVLQACIAACHARARQAEHTDWARIAELYAELAQVGPSPVVELNRAVAISMSEGPAAGLRLVDALSSELALREYYLLPSVRGDLLHKLRRYQEAAAAFAQAASLTRNHREQELLQERARACDLLAADPEI